MPRSLFCTSKPLSIALACLAAMSLAGCGEDPGPAAAREMAAEWGRLEQGYAALRQQRQALAAQRREKPGGGAEIELEALERQTAASSLDYSRRLATFLNDSPDTPQTQPLRRKAIRRRSEEELETAREFIDRAGDYRRAIEICERALELDPGNPDLLAALARARALRFVTAERFARIKEGMSEDEVKAVLGPPNLHNVRALPGNVVAWFFDRDESGAAAGVWFERKSGKLTVYATDFAAFDPGAEPGPEPPPSSSADGSAAPPLA